MRTTPTATDPDVPDQVQRHIHSWNRRADALTILTTLTGLPLAVWLYGHMLFAAPTEPPWGPLPATLVAATIVAGIATLACRFQASHGRLHLFDTEMQKDTDQAHTDKH